MVTSLILVCVVKPVMSDVINLAPLDETEMTVFRFNLVSIKESTGYAKLWSYSISLPLMVRYTQ